MFRYRIRFIGSAFEQIIQSDDERDVAIRSEELLRCLRSQGLAVRCKVESPAGSEVVKLSWYRQNVLLGLGRSL